MIEKLEEVERRFERLTAELSHPDTLADSNKLLKVTKERAGLERLVDTFRTYRAVLEDLKAAEAMLADPDPGMREMGREELPGLKARRDELDGALKLLLLPKDPNDEKDVIVEIRAGAGGDEAALFAGEVMQLYLRYADRKGWKKEIADLNAGNAGGVKEAVITLSGGPVYSHLKYESGVHRVQRVPATEAQGRIHTSTITVSVLPEAEEVDIQINPGDIERQVMRSTGSGGQSVNTTDSAVRLIHKPTGIVVKCQQEKSQIKNYNQALRMLRAKLYEMEQERIRSARDSTRKAQVGTGDRSEKIRTYNFPQDRLTDHRIGFTRHNLAAVMAGDVEDVVVACRTYYQAEQLRNATGGGPAPTRPTPDDD